METKKIEIRYEELDNIVFAFLKAFCEIGPDKYPYLSRSMEKTYAKIKRIREEWDRQIKEGAN